MLTLNQMVELLTKQGIPASVDEDNDGQIVIYTGMKIDEGENLIPFDSEAI